jgi:hypothetical protein
LFSNKNRRSNLLKKLNFEKSQFFLFLIFF